MNHPPLRRLKEHKRSVRTCVVTGFGINADDELVSAFRYVGSRAEKVHIRDLMDQPDTLLSYDILALPGGFSYGDHLGSGKVFAGLLKRNLRQPLEDFAASGKLIIGICNGFQVLVKTGILPNRSGTWEPEVSLIHNDSGKFIDRWVGLRFNPRSPCVWTAGLHWCELPIRHGEGKFITVESGTLSRLVEEQLVAVTYDPDNPNGSEGNVAGICDPSGRIFGLMPHPEAFLFPENHPRWTRETIEEGWGLRIFETGVSYAAAQKANVAAQKTNVRAL
jgi:phosphoribosylformylglycinamidine synthase